jgi:hypothetical protein
VDGFDSDAYVVRGGWRGFWVMLAAALGWTGLSAGVLHEHRLTDAGAKIAILRAGGPSLIPGSDGTIRYANRRMTGWRVNRPRLAQAVQRYAAGAPLIDRPRYPPALNWRAGSR